VTSIGFGAFSFCSSLESVSIPEGVTLIGESAFYGCNLLSSIVLPAGITKIKMCAFTSDTTIYCLGSEVGASWNSDWHSNATNHYFYSETSKTGYWHYVNDVPTLW
jgi:hypothetical protein